MLFFRREVEIIIAFSCRLLAVAKSVFNYQLMTYHCQKFLLHPAFLPLFTTIVLPIVRTFAVDKEIVLIYFF